MSEESAFPRRHHLFVAASEPRAPRRVTGLAVLSSMLSSVAYATDFILATRVVAGVGAAYAVPIRLVIATLLTIVAFSYHSDHAYPTGGGVIRERMDRAPPRRAARGLHVLWRSTLSGC
jgi:hypothetical protein